jgi:DNA-binding beta-propeller fold protein YncE
MRRYFCFALAAVAGLATAAAAAEGAPSETPPSLEYRPPRVVVPEPKAPHPLAPMAVFREIIGSLGMLTGSFDRPTDVARDESGVFYVLDAGNNRIQKFDRFGNFEDSCGRSGISDGEFDRPASIALGPAPGASDELLTHLYVVDTGNHRIQYCDTARMFDNKRGTCECQSWGSRCSSSPSDLARACFNSPRDIAFTPNNATLVLDSGNERVQFFDLASLRLLQIWSSSTGVNGGVFTDLVSLAFSEERTGYIYLLGAKCVVQQFKLSGMTVGDWSGMLVNSWPAIPPESGLCVPARIETDRKYNYVYVLDSGNSQLSCYNPDGLYRWTLVGAQAPFAKPLGFAVDSRGEEFLVSDTGNNFVQKFTLR